MNDYEIEYGEGGFAPEPHLTIEWLIAAASREGNRFEERGENERGMYASQEEVDALRSLAATLVKVFGPFVRLGF